MRWLLLLGLLVAGQAWAAVYFVDGDAGNDSNDGSSALLPKLTVGSITIAAGDVLYLKAGTTFEEQVSITVDNVIISNWPTDTDGARNFATGEKSFDAAGKWVIDCQNSRSYGVLGTAASNVSVMDGEIKNCTENGASINLDTASTTDGNWLVARVISHDIGPGDSTPSGETDYNDGTCFFARTGPTTGTAVLRGILYVDTVAYNCGKHGYDTRWRVEDVRYQNNYAFLTGLSATGHGFSAHPLFAEYISTTGWTDVDGGGAGTVNSRARASTNDNEQRFVNQTDNTILTQNTATPTTPSSGEWGVDATTLYVNTGAALTGKTLLSKRNRHGPFTYVGNISCRNDDSQAANEGHGFSADDLSGPANYFGNYACENDGDGFKTLRGENIIWSGNIARDNGDSGFAITNCTNCLWANNTADGNAARGFYDIGITSVNVDVVNNIAVNDLARGFSVGAGTTGAAGYSDADNISFGNANNGCTGVADCTAVDPQFAEGSAPGSLAGYCLKPTSTLLAAGTYIGAYATGYAGHDLGKPPAIGARGTCVGRARAASRPVAAGRAQ